MNPVPDRKRLRRAYLRRKGAAYARIAVGLTTLMLMILTFSAVVNYVCYVIGGEPVRSYLTYLHWVYIGLPFMCAMILLVWRSVATMLKGVESVMSLPHLRSVTPSTLPAEEILVRGATEPSARNETLLRAGVKGEETKVEELLRISRQ
jgi:hypothetical protein